MKPLKTIIFKPQPAVILLIILITTGLALLNEISLPSSTLNSNARQTIKQLVEQSASILQSNNPHLLQVWIEKMQEENKLAGLAVLHDNQIVASSGILDTRQHQSDHSASNQTSLPYEYYAISIKESIPLKDYDSIGSKKYLLLTTVLPTRQYHPATILLLCINIAFILVTLFLLCDKKAHFFSNTNMTSPPLSRSSDEKAPSSNPPHPHQQDEKETGNVFTPAPVPSETQMEKSDCTEKSRLLAAASHDLRQPMHALLLFISELEQRLHKPEDRHLVQRIIASAEAMSKLLDSLLDISKLDTGAIKPNVQPFPLQPIIERIITEQRPKAITRDLRLKARPTTYWVNSDPILFERIISNFINNAINYTHQGAILVACRRRTDKIHIEVRDSGVGIPEELINSVFEEFVRLDRSEKSVRKESGSGLGLPITRRLAELLNHPLTARSKPGYGSIFTIIIPQAQPIEIEESTEQKQFEHNIVNINDVCVALIDDDPLARLSMESLLRSWGCNVFAAPSLNHLLEKLEENELTPDLLIADFILPDQQGNGLDAIRILRERIHVNLPAALISGDTTSDTLRLAQAAGVPLLHKPVRPARLRALIQRLQVKPEDTPSQVSTQ